MLLPLADVLPFRRVPWVTIVAIALHAASFLLQPIGHSSVPASASAWPPSGWMIGARSAVQSIAMHLDWLHLAGNLAALWLFGSTLEDRLGRRRFALFYIVACAVTAATIQVARPGTVLALGASGAIAAVITAYLLLFPTSRILALFVPIFWIDIIEIPALVCASVWMMLQIVSAAAAMATGIAVALPWEAYATGAALGLLCASVSSKYRTRQE